MVEKKLEKKLSQKQELDELKKRYAELARLMIVLSGYYTHLEDDFEKDIATMNQRLDKLEKMVRMSLLTR